MHLPSTQTEMVCCCMCVAHPQTTDVDSPFRKPPTSELAERLHLPDKQQEMVNQLVHGTEQDFYNESMEVCAPGRRGFLGVGGGKSSLTPILKAGGRRGRGHMVVHKIH